jgi:hypothetical protein
MVEKLLLVWTVSTINQINYIKLWKYLCVCISKNRRESSILPKLSDQLFMNYSQDTKTLSTGLW